MLQFDWEAMSSAAFASRMEFYIKDFFTDYLIIWILLSGLGRKTSINPNEDKNALIVLQFDSETLSSAALSSSMKLY